MLIINNKLPSLHQLHVFSFKIFLSEWASFQSEWASATLALTVCSLTTALQEMLDTTHLLYSIFMLSLLFVLELCFLMSVFDTCTLVQNKKIIVTVQL